MAVAAGNPAVLVVDAKLGALPAADRAAAIDGRAFRFVMTARTARAATSDVPSPVRVRNNMVGLWSAVHVFAFRSCECLVDHEFALGNRPPSKLTK